MADHPDVIAQIEASFAVQTPTGKRIAGYLLANLAQVPFETADSIARSTATSGISVGRYLRSLGYRNLDDSNARCVSKGRRCTNPGESPIVWGLTASGAISRSRKSCARR